MVARDKITKKAYNVPSLQFSSEKSTFRIINELGFQRQKIRKNEANKAIEFHPPTYEESAVIHNLSQLVKGASNKSNYISIASTCQRNTMLMHVEDKNLSGKVFGGFILRSAYELGWLCVYKFIKNASPVISHVD
jgi:acyl-coenzyme A thioesterase 9